MKSSYSKNSIASLVALLGLIIVVFTYAFGLNSVKNKTEEVVSKNRILMAQAAAYEQLYVTSPTYIKEMAEFESEKGKYIDGFIYGMSTTDKIMYLTNLENTNKGGELLINYFNLGSYTSVEYEGGSSNSNPMLVAAGIPSPTVIDDGVKLYEYPMDFGFSVTYDGFKDMVEYLNVIGGYKTIESLTLSFDSSTGTLAGALSYNQLVLAGTGAKYEEIGIPHVNTGLDNIFGTIEIKPAEVEPSEEDAE